MDDSESDTPFQQTVVDGPRRATPGELTIGGRYRVQEVLGRGGMGEVFVARDEQVGRAVAIKRMRDAAPSATALHRFLREARVQGRLEHPAIVPVHEIGYSEDGLPFFVMKKVAGTTLADLIDQDVPRNRLLRAFVDVCLATEFAHVSGVIHRDLKPANIVLGDFGEVYVLDWGIAKVIDDPDGELGDIGTLGGSSAMTHAGAMIGTPGFMSPEQIRGQTDLDARSDVYSLGCVLFEILAGSPLYPPTDQGLAQAVAGLDARPSWRAPDRSIPPELDDACVAATMPERDQRIATARELGERVQRFLDGDRDVASRRQLAADRLATAQAAFARADRGDAMRAAAGAIALDPTLGGAAELVGRLMLEPPSAIPPELRRDIDHDMDATRARIARAGVFIYLTFLAFAGLIWWISPPGNPWAAILAAPMLACLVICWYGSRRPQNDGWRFGTLIVLNAAMIAIVARVFGPLYVAPGLAAVTGLTLLITPSRLWLAQPLAVGVALELAVMVPWLLERLDVLARTTFITDQGLLIHGLALGGHEGRTLLVATMYSMGVIAIPCIVAWVRRRHERTTKQHLLLQAWQLRQLVPSR